MTELTNAFNEDYYEHGEEKGISGYTNYRWMQTRTLTTASAIIRRANIHLEDRILDYGCAKGYLVKAFRMLGYNAFGTDISEYALENADEAIKDKVFFPSELPEKSYDIVVAKDVLEHIPYESIDGVLENIFELTNKTSVFIIPLGHNGKYVVPSFDNDITHFIRESQDWWLSKIIDAGGIPITYTDNVNDIKPNWNVPNGNLYVESTPNQYRNKRQQND